jgi:hypothetical protein
MRPVVVISFFVRFGRGIIVAVLSSALPNLRGPSPPCRGRDAQAYLLDDVSLSKDLR